MGAVWLRQLKERLESGQWLEPPPRKAEPAGILTVLVGQNHRIGLLSIS